MDRPVATQQLEPWSNVALDLAGCDRLEISVPLYEHENTPKVTIWPASWPEPIRVRLTQVIDEWREKNTEREPRAVTCGLDRISGQLPCCVLILHHARKT